MLTMRPYMTLGEGPALAQNRKDFAFEVLGLPEGKEARIAEIHHRWQVLRISNGVSSGWVGDFATAEQALQSLM